MAGCLERLLYVLTCLLYPLYNGAGGILAVSEFLPDPDYPLRSTTIRRGLAAGFELDAALGNFWTYTVRFRKPDKICSSRVSTR
jgi:hypothetical protein